MSDKYPEYKAGRSSTPDEFRGQIDITKEVLVALGITVLAEPGFEADDIIATLATQAEDEGTACLLSPATATRCNWSRTTSPFCTRGGGRELTRFTPEAVEEKYGLTPPQYPDFAALRGDPSDNLPGIPGVGEKTATKWIAEYGRFSRWSTTSTRCGARSAMRCGRTCARGDEPRLTELVRDVPLAQTPDTLRCSRGTATRSTASSTTWSSGCCGIACSRRWRRPTRSGPGFRGPRRRARAG